MAATSTLLLATGQTADNRPRLFGIDKKTGKRVGAVPTPRIGGYGLMTYLHQGKQYVVIPVNGGYTALALPYRSCPPQAGGFSRAGCFLKAPGPVCVRRARSSPPGARLPGLTKCPAAPHSWPAEGGGPGPDRRVSREHRCP